MNILSLFNDFTDDALIAEVKVLATGERHAIARLIASLAELDARRLYLGQGCSSMFVYCTRVLRLSEHAAYGRIEAARIGRRFPLVLTLLIEGAVNLTTLGLLAPHLTPENHKNLLRAATHKSKREVEHLVAALRPQPDVSCSVRRLPTPKPTDVSSKQPAQADSESADLNPSSQATYAAVASPRPPVVAPLAAERYKIQLTISRDTYEKLRRLQDLLRHSVPNGDIAIIVDRALTVLLTEIERKKLASTERPRQSRGEASRSRHIPAALKRAVWQRDGGRCAFVGAEGRCEERGFLEFHHVQPYAAGGKTTAKNLELRCRAHNAFEAERFFGNQPLLLREQVGTYTSFY